LAGLRGRLDACGLIGSFDQEKTFIGADVNDIFWSNFAEPQRRVVGLCRRSRATS
tara:strand:+ start:2932 stop:3096 length:165 start_codon:yes stop_codon:yes gene_type:complete